jgi:hypothetical protein
MPGPPDENLQERSALESLIREKNEGSASELEITTEAVALSKRKGRARAKKTAAARWRRRGTR